MGKINSYQRKQLASSVVGTAPQDTSGQVIGKSVESLGAALVKRQDTLDTALASTAYYDYVAAANLGVMELQKKYQSDPTLDPLTFNTEYQKGAAVLAQGYKDKLPNRVQNTFGMFVAKANANQVIANNKWSFAQQNKNALLNFQTVSMGAQKVAGDSMNPNDFLLNRAQYKLNAEAAKAILTPPSYKAAVGASLKQQAFNFWNNSIDFSNGGRPDMLADSLKEHELLRETLQQDMGTMEFKRLEAGLKKITNVMGESWGNDLLFANNKALSEKMAKVWIANNDYGMKEVANDLEAEINKRNHMITVNNQGQYDSSIAQTENNIKNLKRLQNIAIGVNDASIAPIPAKKSELFAKINVAMNPYGKGDFQKRLQRVQKDIANQTAEQDVKYPWYAYMNPWIIGVQSYRDIERLITKVPMDIRREETEDIKANKTVSQFIEDAQTIKGEVMHAVAQGELTHQESLDMFSLIDLAIGVEGYDSLTSQRSNWFTQGYSAFSTYARDLNLRQGTNVQSNRRVRDDIRTQMMDRFSTIAAGYRARGVTLSDGKNAEIIAQVKYEKSQQIHPELMGAKDGDLIDGGDGKPVIFRGYDNNGNPIIDKPGLDKAVNNL
jgi:hypothetical protein